ncbi:ADP-ribosylglycohydrolase [Haloferula luteola]|uniref:ADP-ribosylglycohydrolase n=1 Tax=Haloferula luteola TaxID=595692 RepID=A0A840V317_9BACT|nr:ADP-ribosylglycohydrolase [Haloferula luteola]
MTTEERIHALLLGTAIGDSVGLPAEGLSPANIAKRAWGSPWKQRFIASKGMWSDDTEHTILLTQALNHSHGDPRVFQRHLARSFRYWMLLLPAGVGFATARSIIKLWFGFSADRSGVFSAGNGPMMRAALLGPAFPHQPEKRQAWNRLQTRITHTDPKAEWSSRAIVEIAALFAEEDHPTTEQLFERVSFADSSTEFRRLLDDTHRSLIEGESLATLITRWGGHPHRGISGYAYHTLAAILYVGVRHDWRAEVALPEVWSLGGDTDTTGAILGALCGCRHGLSEVPKNWTHGILEFPAGPTCFATLAKSICQGHPLRVRGDLSPRVALRNLLFLAIVLGHVLIRWIPRFTPRASQLPKPNPPAPFASSEKGDLATDSTARDAGDLRHPDSQ